LAMTGGSIAFKLTEAAGFRVWRKDPAEWRSVFYRDIRR